MRASQSRLNYLFFKALSLIMLLTLMLTTYMAIVNYKHVVRLHLVNYNHLLTVLEKSYLKKIFNTNKIQLEVLSAHLDLDALRSGESAINQYWPIVHRIKMPNQHAIHYYDLNSNTIESYPLQTTIGYFKPQHRPWADLLNKSTDEPSWVGIYEKVDNSSVLIFGKKVIDSTGTILGLLLVDAPLESLHQTLRYSLGELNASLYLEHKPSQNLISIVNPNLLDANTTLSPKNYFSLAKTWNGSLILHELPGSEWQLGLYLPPSHFTDILKSEMSKVLFPTTAIALLAGFGIMLLIRIFKHEQTLISDRIQQIDGNEIERVSNDKKLYSWFVGKNLDEIEALEKKYHIHQKELRLDPLTGVFNRRAFNQDLEAIDMSSSDYTLILIDLDDFKKINDNYGHQLGDLVLCRVVDTLVSVLGLENVYRIGGDEFAAILMVDSEIVPKLLDRLQKQVCKLKWREKNCTVTLSIGVTKGQRNYIEAISLADAALYRSKEKGRNCWSY
ncbi:diguanylate cyclase [Aeromonas veronii]|uniref:GGDEF domain-containing protein n=1 Tax=Aeromonas veronii TaxID=654 RepID=UPI002258F054|nr:diguanylate cyclase [Aeromonas veronii]MCX4043528.1 diguanylate cyclase [Aeromonas veronii]